MERVYDFRIFIEHILINFERYLREVNSKKKLLIYIFEILLFPKFNRLHMAKIFLYSRTWMMIFWLQHKIRFTKNLRIKHSDNIILYS